MKGDSDSNIINVNKYKNNIQENGENDLNNRRDEYNLKFYNKKMNARNQMKVIFDEVTRINNDS